MDIVKEAHEMSDKLKDIQTDLTLRELSLNSQLENLVNKQNLLEKYQISNYKL